MRNASSGCPLRRSARGKWTVRSIQPSLATARCSTYFVAYFERRPLVLRRPPGNPQPGQEIAIDFLTDLLEGTLAWLLIRPPPQNGSPVAEATAGEMIVRNFNDVFWLHRLPLGRPLRGPTAWTSGGFSREALDLPFGLELIGQVRLVLGLDTRRKSHVMKQAVIVVEPK